LIQKEITVINRLGVHARPSALVVQTANKFKSEIKFKRKDLEVNAKSIMGVMMLAAEMGSKILIQAEGEDEAQAVEALAKLFEDKFGEE
jgi:phosphotransferase system HPr (HPr) family protein